MRAALVAVAAGRIVENVGFFPEEGKYNRTACMRVYEQYSVGEAEALGWRCSVDGGLIKKGVRDRASELSTGAPAPRPPYKHMIPLAEIVQRVLGVASPYSKRCQLVYDRLLVSLGSEIEVLFHRSTAEIREIHAATGDAVDALRHGRVSLYPGGGGKFGTFSFIAKKQDREDEKQAGSAPLQAER